MRTNILKSKKGLELQANFLVMLLLAIAVFGFGIFMLAKIGGQTKKVQSDLDEDTENYLKNMAMSGKVALYPESAEMKIGETRVFGYQIKNVGSKAFFKVGVSIPAENQVDSDGNQLPTVSETDFTFDTLDDGDIGNNEAYEIEKNSRQIISIPIHIPKEAKKGRYTFAIKAYVEDSSSPGTYVRYEGAKMLYITVK